MSDGRLKALIVTREKYPFSRVDLVDLFSGAIAGSGFMEIDWVTQSSTASSAREVEAGAFERFFIGASKSGKGVAAKAANHFLGLVHDIRIWTLSKRKGYDIIQVRDKYFAALIGLVAARRSGACFIYWMSFPYAEADIQRVDTIGDALPLVYRVFYRIRGRLTKWMLYSIILPRSDHIFVQSDRMLEDVSSEGVPEGKMTPVPMGVSLDRINPDMLEIKLFQELSGKMPVVYMGTMVRLRGLDFLIDAFVPVARRFPDAVLLMVGGGSDSDMRFLRDAAEKNGLADRVLFAGQVPMQLAWQYVRASRVCLSPFKPNPVLDSTSPTKVVEYLALERPVVVNDHPDQAKVVHESGGGEVTPYDPQAFGEGIIRILDDEHRGEEMGKAGREYVIRHRSYEVISKKVADVYASVVQAKTTGQNLERAV